MVLFAAVTLAVWIAIAIVWWLWSRGRRAADLDRIRARLAEGREDFPKAARQAPALIQAENRAAGKVVASLLRRLRLNQHLKLAFEQAGLKWDVARTIHGSFALFLAGFTAVWHLAPLYRAAAPFAGITFGAAPMLYVLRKRKRRLRKFEAQFPEVLEFLGRAMRAGHAFSVSLEMIHSEFADPVGGEFKRAFDEQNLGMPLELALAKMAERVPLLDVHFFVSAVVLQKRTGGNLAELLDKLAYLIRERFKLRGRIRAISAHGRMTGVVLSLIPIVVGLMMCYVNPSFARFFVEDETGRAMLGGAIGLQIIGYAVIRSIVSIEV